MAIIVDGENLNTPFFVDDIGVVDISTQDFDPITNYRDFKYEDTDMHASRIGNYSKKGFLVKLEEAGSIYVITLRAFKDAIKHPEGSDDATILATLVPELMTLIAGEWLPVRLIKVFAADSSPELSLADSIVVGTIL